MLARTVNSVASTSTAELEFDRWLPVMPECSAQPHWPRRNAGRREPPSRVCRPHRVQAEQGAESARSGRIGFIWSEGNLLPFSAAVHLEGSPEPGLLPHDEDAPQLTVDRVVLLSSGDCEVHMIAVNWPHHVFVNSNFTVIGAEWARRRSTCRTTAVPG